MGKTRRARGRKIRRVRSRRVQRGGGTDFITSLVHIRDDIRYDGNLERYHLNVIHIDFNNLIALINTIQPGVLDVDVAASIPSVRKTTAPELYEQFHTLNETLKNACIAKRGIFTSTPADKINAARKAINQHLHSAITEIHKEAKEKRLSTQPQTQSTFSPTNLMLAFKGF
jgi:hypothetical protein